MKYSTNIYETKTFSKETNKLPERDPISKCVGLFVQLNLLPCDCDMH